jgi:hypothetical protein
MFFNSKLIGTCFIINHEPNTNDNNMKCIRSVCKNLSPKLYESWFLKCNYEKLYPRNLFFKYIRIIFK